MSPNLLIWIYRKKINQNAKVWLSAYFKGNCLSSALNAIYLSLAIIMKLILYITFTIFSFNVMAQTEYENYSEALNHFEKVKKLRLVYSNQGTEKLDSRITKLQSLESIEIVNYKGSILTLPKELNKLPNLTSISISAEEIKTIPENIFEIKSLKNLSLYFYNLDHLPDNEFKKLSNLEKLTIRGDGLKTIPIDIYNLSKLKDFTISGDKLVNLPDGINYLVNLNKLTIHALNLETLPRGLNELHNLNSIDIFCKNDLEINLDYKKQKIEKFRWGKCKKFPLAICSFKTIERLTFDSGFIEKIPNEISNLINITELEITGHPITVLPNTILNLKKLEFLHLSSTKLNSFNESIFNLPNIFKVNLEYCNELPKTDLEVWKEKYGNKLYY